VDFADVKAIMSNAGTAIMGIGIASGDNRSVEAAEQAIASPLLESSIEGARGILLNISAGGDLTLDEVYEAANVVHRAADSEDAFIIMGCVIDESLQDEVRVTVLATGFQGQGGPGELFRSEPAQIQQPQRSPSRTFSSPSPSPMSSPSASSAQASAQQNDLDIPPFLRKGR
jgi:cell division protein FtsZ